MKKVVFSLLTCLASAGHALADVYTGGGGIVIPDNTPAGGSSTISAINILNPTIFTFDSVTIVVSTAHTWIGDLTVTLTSPTGITVQLFRRPGASGVGSSGDWTAGTYVFVLSGGLSMPTTNVATNVTPGTYNITSNPGSTQIIPPSDPDTYSAFTGLNLNGTWTLNISDNAAGDTGAISGWSMNITSIPEPTTAALLLLAAGGLGAAAWRKRRTA
jgi:subtilisin-like proprotein convertase family protein